MSCALKWKSVWITGAGKGIGRALAIELAYAGVNVIASSRTLSDLESLKQDCHAASGDIQIAPLDTRDTDQLQVMVKQWHESDSFPDLVVLNAGTHDAFAARRFSAERAKHLLDVNLQGTLNCLEPALKHYTAQNKGQIAIMASVAGYRGLPTAAVYGASKAALINLAESINIELKPTNVKLQIISPGFVRTPLTDKNTFEMPFLMEPDEAAKRILSGMQSRRFEITFPRRFSFMLKLFSYLPYSTYAWLIALKTNK